MNRGTLGVGVERETQAHRRPACGYGIEMSQRSACGLPFGFESIDPQVERGADGQRDALGAALAAKATRQMGIEPLRIMAGDPGRSAGEIGRAESRAFVGSQWRRRKASAVGTRGNRLAVELALEAQHAEHDGA